MSMTMGNDEFILYIRKRYPDCATSNDALGRGIWRWIRAADPQASKLVEDEDCY
jgi:hypothetical protein